MAYRNACLEKRYIDTAMNLEFRNAWYFEGFGEGVSWGAGQNRMGFKSVEVEGGRASSEPPQRGGARS